MTNSSIPSSPPLRGIRVLDLSRVLAGPYCTQMLGDLGAEITKIEKPFAGDDTRFWGPPFLKDKDGTPTKESAYYLSVNRNKQSVAIDITHKDGQQLIRQLLADSDILIENFKVGSLAKYGLAYDQLASEFPKLIYCSISGYGQSGPLAHDAGYDLVAQAMGGMMASTGLADGPPLKCGIAISDLVTGLHALIGILAALRHRDETGIGQRVDVSLLDCTLATMTNLAQYYLTSGSTAPRHGNAHAMIVPYQAFHAADGWFVLAVGNDQQFSKLCHILGHPGWAESPLYETNTSRIQNRDALISLINEALSGLSAHFVVTACREAGIPCGPVYSLAQSFSAPQALANNMKISLPHPGSGVDISLVGSPLKFSETPVSYHNAPPVLGQDTRHVLGTRLGISDEILSELARTGVIQIT